MIKRPVLWTTAAFTWLVTAFYGFGFVMGLSNVVPLLIWVPIAAMSTTHLVYTRKISTERQAKLDGRRQRYDAADSLVPIVIDYPGKARKADHLRVAQATMDDLLDQAKRSLHGMDGRVADYHERIVEQTRKIKYLGGEMTELMTRVEKLKYEAAEMKAWHEITYGPESLHGRTQSAIETLDLKLDAEAERQRVAAMTPEELEAETEAKKWDAHITHTETQLAGALGIPVEMLWDRIPGWTETDSKRAKELVERNATVQDMLEHLESLPSPDLTVDVLPPAEVERIHNEITSVDEVIEYRTEHLTNPIRADHNGLKCYTVGEAMYGRDRKDIAQTFYFCDACYYWHLSRGLVKRP